MRACTHHAASKEARRLGTAGLQAGSAVSLSLSHSRSLGTCWRMLGSSSTSVTRYRKKSVPRHLTKSEASRFVISVRACRFTTRLSSRRQSASLPMCGSARFNLQRRITPLPPLRHNTWAGARALPLRFLFHHPHTRTTTTLLPATANGTRGSRDAPEAAVDACVHALLLTNERGKANADVAENDKQVVAQHRRGRVLELAKEKRRHLPRPSPVEIRAGAFWRACDCSACLRSCMNAF